MCCGSIMITKLFLRHILAICSSHLWMMQRRGPSAVLLARSCEAAPRSFEQRRRPLMFEIKYLGLRNLNLNLRQLSRLTGLRRIKDLREEHED